MSLLGIGLFAYPMFANYLFEKHASSAAQEYDNIVNDKAAGEIKEAYNAAVTYNENLEGNPAHDPFLAGSGMVLSENYLEVLNFDEAGTMGYITIPKINVKLSIYHGTADSTLQEGVGHLEGSSLPIGGESSHSVLTGHTGLAHAKMFTDLTKLEEGDTFYLHVLDQVLAYEVDQIKVVEPENTDDLHRELNKDYCTLITCTPYGVNSHRLLVRGSRIPYVAEDENAQVAESEETKQNFADVNMLIGSAAGIGALVVLFIALALKRRKKNIAAQQRKIMEKTGEIKLYLHEEEKAWKGKSVCKRDYPETRSGEDWEYVCMPGKKDGGMKKIRQKTEKMYWWDEVEVV